MQALSIWVISLALIFDFLIGVHGSGNVVSTMIASRAFRPRVALAIGASAEFLGPFLFGAAVARTVGAQLVDPAAVTHQMLIAALVAAIAWQGLTWLLGIPSSSSHGLVGGILGAALMGAGRSALQLAGLYKVLAALFAAPLICLGLGFVLLRLIYVVVAGATPRINDFFKGGQLFTVIALALSQGANDAQKAIGVIVLSLVVGGSLPAFVVPIWVVVACASVMALGTVLGGWRLIRTIGGKFYKVRPVHSFSAQLASAVVMMGASLLGWPVSAAQVVSSAIVGVGTAERVSQVRWGVVVDILAAWVITIPATALIASGAFWVIDRVI